MQHVNDLACPQCQGPFDYQLMFEHEGEECGFLHCPNCQLSTPFVLGFPFFTETMTTVDAHQTSRLTDLVKQVAPGEGYYGEYIEQKFQRGVFEVYAAFQPFNESTRSIYPLIDAWRNYLKPGELILDIGCRTGWSGELLAALFPQQRVLSIWEGNSSVLGYRGFYYWLNSKRRSANLEIIFSPANAPFPIRSDSIMLVHAYDSLHRNPLPEFANECLRVAEKRGILCFPHVHLNNNQPNPFFERGGQYRHGKEYQDYFHGRLEKDGRKPLVLSEISMFQRNNDTPLSDDADTDHYNGLILIAEKSWYRQAFTNRLERELTTDTRLIPNPLITVDPQTRKASLNNLALSDNADYLLKRHPMYEKQINSKLPMELTGEQLALIVVAESGANLQKCAQLLNRPLYEVITTAQSLASNEIVAALPISKAAFELQQFHANNHTVFQGGFSTSFLP